MRGYIRDEEGQGLAEYALILALIAIVAIVALIFLGGQVSEDPEHRRQVDLGRSTCGSDGTATTWCASAPESRAARCDRG